MIVIGVAAFALNKIYRLVLESIEFDSKAVGNAGKAHTASPTAHSQARERQIGIVDDKGESISTPTWVDGPRDLPLERCIKATLNRLFGGEPRSANLVRLINCQTQPIFKQYRVFNQG
jgi:hypothetical protein